MAPPSLRDRQTDKRKRTGTHGDDGNLVARLSLISRSSEWSTEISPVMPLMRNRSRVRQVTHLVERRRVGVVRFHSGDGDGHRQLAHLLHDVGDVGRMEEDGRVVVDVDDGDGDGGRVVADVVARILHLHRQHVLRPALEIQILGHSDEASLRRCGSQS